MTGQEAGGSEPTVLRALVDMPSLGIRRGEDVVVDPGPERRCSHVRSVDRAAVATAFRAGQMLPLRGPVPAEFELEAPGLTTPTGRRRRTWVER